MIKLRYGYLIAAIITGLILFIKFLWSLPDGRLHIVFCNVGQGDAVYIRLADGKDMLIDGGPNNKVINCLSKHMPFWDRTLDMVALTHPQKDHGGGLYEVLSRYQVKYFLKSDIGSDAEFYQNLLKLIQNKKINIQTLTQGNTIDLGTSSLSVVWPTQNQVVLMNPKTNLPSNQLTNVLSASSFDLNDGSLVLHLSYGSFDALFTGDADNRVNSNFLLVPPPPDGSFEVLKYPHHGSKTGLTGTVLDWMNPKLAVISVGTNSYGHPTSEALQLLTDKGVMVKRTDKDGDVEVVSDGKSWQVAR